MPEAFIITGKHNPWRVTDWQLFETRCLLENLQYTATLAFEYQCIFVNFPLFFSCMWANRTVTSPHILGPKLITLSHIFKTLYICIILNFTVLQHTLWKLSIIQYGIPVNSSQVAVR